MDVVERQLTAGIAPIEHPEEGRALAALDDDGVLLYRGSFAAFLAVSRAITIQDEHDWPAVPVSAQGYTTGSDPQGLISALTAPHG